MEVWKSVKGFASLYQVSSEGNVKSFHRSSTGDILYPHRGKDGYLQVGLTDDMGTKRNYRVHRLVAETFLSNPRGLFEVCHRDEDKDNNAVDNLVWSKVNKGEKHPKAKLTEKQVLEIYAAAWSPCVTDAYICELYNITRKHVSKIRLGKLWNHVTHHVKTDDDIRQAALGSVSEERSDYVTGSIAGLTENDRHRDNKRPVHQGR